MEMDIYIYIYIYIYAKPHLVERAGNYVKWAEVGVGHFLSSIIIRKRHVCFWLKIV